MPNASIVVNQNTTIRFVTVLPDLMNNGDSVVITFPSGSKFYSPSLAGSFQFGGGTTNGLTVTFNIVAARTLTSGSSLSVSFSTYTAPSSTKATQPFTFSILRDGNPKMTGTATLQATMSSLSFTVTPTSSVVSTNTTYVFAITLTDQLSSSGRIVITFPSTISQAWTSSSCAQLTGSGVNAFATCVRTGSTLTLTNLNLTTSNILTQTLTVSVLGVINPASTQPSGTFNITTYYSSTDDTSVSTGVMGSVTAIAAALNSTNVLITPSSYRVYDSNVAYAISFLTTNSIPVGGYVVMGVPYAIPTAITSVGTMCLGAINSAALSSVACTAINNTANGLYEITFTNLFASQGVSAAGNVTLKVTSVFTNPISTESVGSFSLTTYTSSGYMIDRLATGLNVAMTIPADFSSVVITPASKVNSAVTSYTFTLAQPSQFGSGSKLQITFPAEIIPQSSTTCNDSSSALVCSVNAQTVTVSLLNTVSNSNFTVIVGAAKNYASLKPSGAFGFATRTSTGGYYSQNLNSLTISNAVPSSFPSLTSVFSPQILSTGVTVSITLTPSSAVTGSIVLSLASSFQISSLSCSLSFSGSCNVASNAVTITSVAGSSSLSFTVSGMVSPKVVPTDFSSLTTYDSGNYIIDQSTSSIIFGVNCTLPCRTCSTTATTCTSCYNDSAITTKMYFNSGTSNCVDACEAGYFADASQMKCNPCSSICLTCSPVATNCTSCNSTSGYPYLNKTASSGTCLAACPSGMYADANQSPILCVNCVAPCATCTTQTACLSCTSGTYLYQTSCLSSCPANITVINAALGVCDPCDAVCATCSISASNCTACANGTAYYNFQCVSSCPSGMVIQNNTCVNCTNPCSTCAVLPTNCTSCNSSSSTPYLLNNSCLSSCPLNYYNSSSSGACLLCSLLPLHCDNCINASACASCNTGYIYFNYTCLLTAPPGYVNISGQAVPCTGDCATCDILQSNCTSCKTLYYLSNQCLTVCPSTYAPVNGVCTACSSPCLTCSQTISNCTACLTTLSPAVYLSNWQCITTCPSGTFASTANYTCAACVSPCSTCTALTLCASCVSGYFLYQQSCLTACPAGYAGFTGICSACQSPCRTCSPSTGDCTSCLTSLSPPMFLTGASCVLGSNCPTLTYPNQTNNECVSCVMPCQTCTSSTTCLTCIAGYNLHLGVCYSNCLDGFTPINSVCTACISPCSTCAGTTTTCLSCNQSLALYYLYNSYCITSCPATKYGSDATYECLPCVSPCYTCTSLSLCLTCMGGYYFYLGACLTTCPTGYVGIVTTCVQCTSNCRTC